MVRRRSKMVKEPEAFVDRNLSLLLESTDHGIYAIDLAATCTYLNKAATEMVGYKPAEVVGKNMHQLIHHSRLDLSPYPVDECPVVTAIRSGHGVRVDSDVLWRKDGTAFPVEYSSYPIVEAGTIKGAVVTFFDITKRKQMEQELREAHDEMEVRVQERTAELENLNTELMEEIAERKRAEADRERLLGEIDRQLRLFQSVFDNAPAGIVTIDGKTLCVKQANGTYRQFLEEPYRSTDIKGLHIRDFLPEAEEVGLVEIFRNVATTGQTYLNPEYEYVGFARGVTYWRWSLTLLPSEGHEVRDLLLLVVEISEQVRARQRIEELVQVAQRQAAELQAVLDNMVDGVFVCDTEQRITLVNEAGVRLLGMASAKEVKRALAELPELLRMRYPDGSPVSPEEMPLVLSLAGETPVLVDQIIYNGQTQRDVFVRSNASPIRDRTGKIVGAVEVARDVTELIELDRLKDQFIEVAAHELKTPVTGIRGYAQYLIQWEHEGISPQGAKALQAINRQAERISRLINELLDISQLQMGQLELSMEKIALPQLVEEVADRMALTSTKRRIRLVKAEPVVVQGDRGRLEQVLVNLLDNGIRYSPPDGDIDVSVVIGDHEAIVSVRDYGVGIPRDKQARIFQRFYRAHTGTPFDHGGMGVGLYISSEIVKRHGGRMWFESEEGKGSTFSFGLPLT